MQSINSSKLQLINFDSLYIHVLILNVLQNLHRNTMIEDITGKKMRAMDIFSISIKYLKDTMLETMNIRLADGIISEKDIDFVLTVPAIWGDEAKFFMREAAIQVRWLALECTYGHSCRSIIALHDLSLVVMSLRFSASHTKK